MSKLIHYFVLILFDFYCFYIIAYTTLNKLFAVFFIYNTYNTGIKCRCRYKNFTIFNKYVISRRPYEG